MFDMILTALIFGCVLILFWCLVCCVLMAIDKVAEKTAEKIVGRFC